MGTHRMVVGTRHDGMTTEVEIRGWERHVGIGKAVCGRKDHYVSAIGEGIALGRALEDLGQKIAVVWNARSMTEKQFQERKKRKQVQSTAVVDDLMATYGRVDPVAFERVLAALSELEASLDAMNEGV